MNSSWGGARYLTMARRLLENGRLPGLLRAVADKANPGLAVVQLYRDYLLNFMINKNQDRAAGQAGTQGARA